MHNTLHFHDAWSDYRAAVKAARARYTDTMERLAPYMDSAQGKEDAEEAATAFKESLEAARATARPRFSKVIGDMREHVGKPTMTPPTAEQLATLQALQLRESIEAGEVEAAASLMKGNDLAMRALRDVVKSKGQVVPKCCVTVENQAQEAIEKLAKAASDLLKWDGRTGAEIGRDAAMASHAHRWAGGDAPSGYVGAGRSVAEVEASTYRQTVRDAINAVGSLHVDASGFHDVIPRDGVSMNVVDALG